MARNLVVARKINEDTRAIDVNLEPGVIVTGEVVGSDGKTIGNTRILMKLQDSAWQSILRPIILESDAEGRFEIRALPPGYEYALSTRSMGYREGRINVQPDDVRDNRVDGVSIVLARGEFSISGVVVNASGRPVTDAEVFCYGEGQPRNRVKTGADGKFTLEGVFKGQLTVQGTAYGLYGLADAEAGATNVRIMLNKKAAPPPKGRTCFPAETGVWVNGALVSISSVGPRQYVGRIDNAPAKNSSQPLPYLGKVQELQEHEGVFNCYDILLQSGNRIGVAENHYFLTESGDWAAVQNLKASTKLCAWVSASSEVLMISSSSVMFISTSALEALST